MEILVFKNYDEASRKVAEIIRDLIKEKSDAVLGLATGSTPIGAYEELVKMYENGELSFKDVRTINLDEYLGLKGDHPQSYRYFMNHQLFDKIDIDKDNTHVPNGASDDPHKAAKDYEKIVDELGIDLQLLGIGQNGHIGFNEPAGELELYTHVEDLTESTIKANSRFFDNIEDVPKQAISMGLGSIFKADRIVLMATGENKANAIKTFKDTTVTPLIPASFLKLHPNVCLVLDEAAAKYL